MGKNWFLDQKISSGGSSESKTLLKYEKSVANEDHDDGKFESRTRMYFHSLQGIDSFLEKCILRAERTLQVMVEAGQFQNGNEQALCIML